MEEHTDNATIIRNLEEQLLLPEVRRCTTTVSNLLAEDFIEYGSSGRVYDKQQTVENLLRGDSATRTISQFSTVNLAPGVILATYRCAREETDKLPVHTLRCSVWKRITGQWKMVFHQGTISRGYF